MVAAGTVDEDIYLLGERKKEVNECVLNDSGKKEKDTASTISGKVCRGLSILGTKRGHAHFGRQVPASVSCRYDT